MAFEKIGNFFGIGEDEETSQQPTQSAPANHESVDYTNNEKVVSIDSGSATKGGSSKIAIYQPRVYADAKVVAKQLLNNKAVIVNFNNVNDEQAKRIVDFLTGTVFALNGEIKRVGDKIFLCTPPKFQIDGSIPDIGE